MRYPLGVTRWKSILSLVCLAVWLPAISHCKLESMDAFKFLTCCSHEGKAAHQDDDCRKDVCAGVESGLYKIRDNGPLVTPVVSVFLFLLAPPVFEDSAAEAVIETAAAPFELTRSWQFSLRAASPPR